MAINIFPFGNKGELFFFFCCCWFSFIRCEKVWWLRFSVYWDNVRALPEQRKMTSVGGTSTDMVV